MLQYNTKNKTTTTTTKITTASELGCGMAVASVACCSGAGAVCGEPAGFVRLAFLFCVLHWHAAIVHLPFAF
jgi:hypothetical protein